MTSHLMNTYQRMPVAFEKGEGAWLWDDSGKRYLDAISGLGVCALGHAHPEIADVVADQAGLLLHTSNIARIPWQEKLATELADISGLETVFMANTGTEAIECALKLARLAGHSRNIEQPEVIVMENSFHGRTLAALSASGSRKVQAGFEPLVGGFVRVPFADLDALRQAAVRPAITAIMVEPIQGEAGVIAPPDGYLKAVRELCDRHGWLLICDEIQSGLCRTGDWFAHQYEGIKPDIITSAKALANGLPVGACIAGTEAVGFTPGQHGSTFGGNPLVCRTACKVLEIMRRENLAERAKTTGDQMLSALRERLDGRTGVLDIRGRGLMIGIELEAARGEFKSRALERGLLTNVTQERVIRLLPPLIIDPEQAGQIVNTVCDLIEEG